MHCVVAYAVQLNTKGGADDLVYNGVVALFTADRRYANAFTEHGIQKEKGQVSVKVFTNEESLDYAVRNEKFDLLLIDGMCTNENVMSYDCRIAVLSHERYVRQEEYPSIFIYQKAEVVFRQIYELLSEKIIEDRIDCSAATDMPEIIGVYSPCFPLEREEFARAAASVLGEKEGLLFINLAEFTEADYSDDDGISELLFFIQQEGKLITYKLPALIRQTENYYSLPGVKHYQDLYSIEEEDIKRLMGQLGLVNNINKVIIDIGLTGDNSYSVMKYCGRIYMPVDLNRSLKRHEHFLHDIRLENKDDLFEKISIIELPEWWSTRKELRYNWTRTVVSA